jgi:hypothetical protein
MYVVKYPEYRKIFYTQHVMTTSLVLFCLYKMGLDSVDVATRYGLDGPGIESRWAQGFSALV